MTVGSALLTVLLAAIGVAAFATDPLILAVTLAVAFVTLAVVATRLGRTVNPPFTHPTPEMLFGIPEPADIAALVSADGLMDESEPAPPETVPMGAGESRL